MCGKFGNGMSRDEGAVEAGRGGRRASVRGISAQQLQVVHNRFSQHTLVLGNRLKDAVKGAESQNGMVGNDDPVVSGVLRLKHHVAADLMDELIVPAATQHVRESASGYITRQLHARLRSSLRTRWSRIAETSGWSKQ